MLAAEAPKITDWMQAWGSLAGLVMSTAAVIFTGLLFRHEIRVRREEQRDSEAAQARLIIGAVTEAVKVYDRVVGARWVVVNHSPAPVFNVYVSITNWRLEDQGRFSGESDKLIEILQPGNSQSGSVSFVQDWPEDRVSQDQMWVAAEFFDSSGLQWRREGTEPPKRIIDPFTLEPGFARLTWLYLWPLSRPVSWTWDRCKAAKHYVESHMRMRVFHRKYGHKL